MVFPNVLRLPVFEHVAVARVLDSATANWPLCCIIIHSIVKVRSHELPRSDAYADDEIFHHFAAALFTVLSSRSATAATTRIIFREIICLHTAYH